MSNFKGYLRKFAEHPPDSESGYFSPLKGFETEHERRIFKNMNEIEFMASGIKSSINKMNEGKMEHFSPEEEVEISETVISIRDSLWEIHHNLQYRQL